MNQQKIIILDTTLRDGEQSLQTNLNVKEKLKIAFSLEKLGIDIIEVGFPISSPEDFKSAKTISQQVKKSKICGLARCVDKDIDVAANALKYAENFRIHIFLPTSNLHMKSKLKKNFNQIIEMAIYAINRAKKYTDDIEFSCEDAGRTSIDNLCRIVEYLIKAGAKTINIPDTVGYTIPNQFGNIISSLYNRVPIIDQATISVHCHNDLGMAVANSISAIQAGARQIEGTINGIGERAGNAALEEIIMTIKVHQNLLNVYTNINYKEIYNTSKIVSQICNIPISPNKSIVGSNAFSHSSGIHQDGILKNRRNYEILTPNSIGLKHMKLNLTSKSGRAAVKFYMKKMGYQENHYDINKLYSVFLKLAEKQGQIFDYDLEILTFVNNYRLDELNKHFKLKYFYLQLDSSGIVNTSIKLSCGNKIFTNSSTGNNPINVMCNALIHITQLPINLKEYQFNIKYKYKNKILKKTNLIVKYKKRNIYGIGIGKNIFESFLQAMIYVLNKIWLIQQINSKKNIQI